MNPWAKFYGRNLTLPAKAKTQQFLQHLPQNAHVLDVGSGTGVWAAAFQRDRPDLNIDLVDNNAPHPSLITPDWKGGIYLTDLKSFEPGRIYDGIWANNILFFLDSGDMALLFHKLADKLAHHGIMGFTMLQAGEAAPSHRASLTSDDIRKLLEAEHLETLVIELDTEVEYMVPGGKKKFPTYRVQAKKNTLGN